MAITTVEQEYTNFHGIQLPVITTKGWDVKVKWIDQSIDWVPLHLIKELNKIELEEHAMSNGHYNKPAFI